MRGLIGTLTLCLGMMVTAPLPVLAAEASAEQIRQKINISGRQRMLSQRMAAKSCLSMADPSTTAYGLEAQQAHDSFRSQLTGLRLGSAEMNLPVETNADILAALDEVEATWDLFSAPVQQLAAGYVDNAAMLQLFELNTEVLRLSNAAVQAIVGAHGASDMPANIAKAIDVAGRQRMLTQKMLKEACFVSVGLATEDNVAALLATKDLFERSLNDLRNGNTELGIAPPTSPAVKEQLNEVSVLWEEYKSVLAQNAASAGSEKDAQLLRKASEAADRVLAASHQAVLRYVEASGNG